MPGRRTSFGVGLGKCGEELPSWREPGAHASASRRYALFLAALGRFDEASNRLEIVQRIDPFSNRQKVSFRTRFLQITRRFEEGLRPLSEPLIYGPLPVEARFLLALMSAHVGNKSRRSEWSKAYGRLPAASCL